MREEIRALQQRLKLTVAYVTHDQSEALAVSDQIIVMDHGRIAQRGTPQELYERPASEFVAGFMGEAMLFAAPWRPDGTRRLGPLRTRSRASRCAPGAVQVAVRPEAWHIGAARRTALAAGRAKAGLPRQRLRIHLRHRARPDLRRPARLRRSLAGGRRGPASGSGEHGLLRPGATDRRARRTARIVGMTTSQADKAARFRALHEGPGAFVIANPGTPARRASSPGSASQALATSSGAAAGMLGRRDGEVTRDEALAHAAAIVEATDLPVSADLEKGFGDAPAAAAETIRLAADGRPGRRLDRGRDRRQGRAALRHRPRDRARGGRGRRRRARCRSRSR